MAQLLPSINSTGYYEAEAPYSSQLVQGVVYTCKSLRTFADLSASGVDLWQDYYANLNISLERFTQDVAAGTTIVGLQAGTGEWIYVPSSFLSQIPSVDGYVYTTLVLGVSLGAVPDDFKFAPLITAMENLVITTLGITPQIKAITTGQPTVIPLEDHNKLTLARQTKISITETDYGRAERLANELTQANAKVAALEKYVRESLQGP